MSADRELQDGVTNCRVVNILAAIGYCRTDTMQSNTQVMMRQNMITSTEAANVLCNVTATSAPADACINDVQIEMQRSAFIGRFGFAKAKKRRGRKPVKPKVKLFALLRGKKSRQDQGGAVVKPVKEFEKRRVGRPRKHPEVKKRCKEERVFKSKYRVDGLPYSIGIDAHYGRSEETSHKIRQIMARVRRFVCDTGARATVAIFPVSNKQRGEQISQFHLFVNGDIHDMTKHMIAGDTWRKGKSGPVPPPWVTKYNTVYGRDRVICQDPTDPSKGHTFVPWDPIVCNVAGNRGIVNVQLKSHEDAFRRHPSDVLRDERMRNVRRRYGITRDVVTLGHTTCHNCKQSTPVTADTFYKTQDEEGVLNNVRRLLLKRSVAMQGRRRGSNMRRTQRRKRRIEKQENAAPHLFHTQSANTASMTPQDLDKMLADLDASIGTPTPTKGALYGSLGSNGGGWNNDISTLLYDHDNNNNNSINRPGPNITTGDPTANNNLIPELDSLLIPDAGTTCINRSDDCGRATLFQDDTTYGVIQSSTPPPVPESLKPSLPNDKIKSTVLKYLESVGEMNRKITPFIKQAKVNNNNNTKSNH